MEKYGKQNYKAWINFHLFCHSSFDSWKQNSENYCVFNEN